MTQQRARRSLAALAATTTAALAGTLLLAGPAAAAPAPPTAPPTATLPGSGQLSALASARPATLEVAQAQFEERTPAALREQRPAWAPCTAEQFSPQEVQFGVLELGLECALVSVPRDWGDPAAGEPLSIAISRLHREGPRPERTVLTNPGGPGGAGLSMAVYGTIGALTGVEVVGVDVRGTGASTALECGDEVVAATLALPDPRDRSDAALDRTAELASQAARACQQDPLAPVVTTEQTVADLDLVRAVLERDTIDWFGVSGGTWLGAQYATYFPARVGRFVLDSNVDVTAAWQQAFEYQPMAFQRRFDEDFRPWAARWNWLFRLGADPAAVTRTYEEVRAGLAVEPLQVPGVGAVTPKLLDDVTASSMYSKLAFEDLAWSMLSLRVALLARSAGDLLGVQRATEQAGEAMRVASRSDETLAATFQTITCNDTAWTRGQRAWDEAGDRYGQRFPLVGWSVTSQPCAYYDRPELTLPRPDGRDLPPLLVLQSTHDPATAYEGALRTAAALPSSRTVTVVDEGDHGVYLTGNACVDEVVDAFLLTGAAPEGDVTCEGTGVPAPGTQLLDGLLELLRRPAAG
ncbi:alpha/beta fold hydrolase [Kineococcus sp. T13]|uniref:alpha/beta hydrolase n=1 Tax=Kineococcus vitellinus TaxID=2696565 RepID=UPI0014133C68|nr:alpha/beta hydrolase [Kineococcus vitellinus]NAZ76390.1 alpha/beta fold hydrolase [Kineococcus vitellinus]